MENNEKAIISRRTFLTGAAATAATLGFIELLPSVPGGYLAPNFLRKTAYGEPNDAYFKLAVVGADQVGFHVVDVATLDDAENATPVPNAHIKVISRADSSKYVEGDTDEEGKIILDIGDLALRDSDDNLINDRYQFNATIEVSGGNCRPVMRDVTIGLVHVDGATGVVIATHILEDGDDENGYVERLGFDEWDILYTKNTFVRSAENDIAHGITVRLKGIEKAPDSPKIRTSFIAKEKDPWDKDKTIEKKYDLSFSPKDSSFDSKKKIYTAVFSGRFLQVGHKDCFNCDEIPLTFEYKSLTDGKKHKITTKFHSDVAPVHGTMYTSPMTPFLTGNGTLGSISSGTDWPIFNKMDISIVNFSFPAHIFYSPYSVMISFGDDFTFIDDKGEDSPNTWKDQAKKPIGDRFKKAMDKYEEALEPLGNRKPYTKKDKKTGNKEEVGHMWAGKFSIKLILGFVLGIQLDEFKGQGDSVTKYFAGKTCLGVGVGLKGSISFKFTIGPVPFYITITGGLELVFAGTFSLTAELIGEQDLDCNSIVPVPDGSISLNIKPSFKLSVGVGLEGVACVSVSGAIALPMYIGWLEPKPRSDVDDTHFTVGYTFKAELSAQFYCFSGSVTIWSCAENPFYDNWKDITPPLPTFNDVALWSEEAGAARFMHTYPDGTKRHSVVLFEDGRILASNGGDIFDNMLPVTMADMKESFEAEATKNKQPVNYSEEDLPDIHRNMIPMVVELEDGTLVTQFVPCEGVNSFTYADELSDSVLGLSTESVEDEEVSEPEESSEETPEPSTDAEQSSEETHEPEESSEETSEPATDAEQSADTSVQTEDGEAAALAPMDGEESSEPAVEGEGPETAATDSDQPQGDVPQGVPATEGDSSDFADAALVVPIPVAADILDVADEPAASDDAEPAATDDVEPEADADAEPAATDGEGSMLETQELEAEADDDDEVDAYVLGDTFLGFGAPAQGEYEYENVEGKTTGAVCGDGGVKGIGLHDGIKPNVDVVIYNNVFSDPRQKIVNINGAPYLFRIMTVDYSFKDENNPIRRPRVVCSKFDTVSRTWGEPKVIEYGSGTNKLKRIDMFDYDFDIVVRSAGTSWTRHVEACLVVTGGIRPQGDNTRVYDAFATPTVSVVFLDENLNVFQRTVKQASELYDDGLAHMVSVPRVRDGFAVNGASGAVAFAFMHRSADEPKKLMSDPTNISFGVGYCYLRDGALSVALKAGRIIDPESDTPIYVDPISLDKSVTSMDIIVGNGVKEKYDALLTLIFYKTTGYEVCAATIPCGKSFADIQVKRCITSNATLPQMAPWPGHGTVLFTKNRQSGEDAQPSDYYLYAGKFDPTRENQPGFEDSYERVDYNGFRGSSFAVSPTGKYLFYYESFNGNPGDEVDPKTGKHTTVHEEVYRIMASKFIDGAFSEDFPFCELDSPIDGFEVMNITDDASTFLATEILDADHSLGRLRYIAVPNTISAEVEGFGPFDAFVCAGSRCSFQVDIRNHGNLIIGGFDVSMYDADNGVKLVGDPFTAQTIESDRVLTTANSRRPWMDDIAIPKEEAYRRMEQRVMGLSTEDADDDMVISEIMPGEVLSYRVEFDIPENWRTSRNVIVRLTNVWSPGIQVAINEPLTIEAGAPITAMLATSEGPVALHLHPGISSALQLSEVEAEAELTDPIEEVEDDDEPTPGPEPEPKPEPIPYTGDLLSGIMTPLGMALGGLGALMGAYSARRTQIEREEAMIDVDEFDVIDE